MDVKVKICGVTNAADARAAMAAGADMLGFIFFPKSPRYVTPEHVRDILTATDPARKGVLTAGVFVNESPEAVAQVLSFCSLDLAQLHGEESPAMLGLGANQSPVCGRAYKALRPCSIGEATDLARRYALPTQLRREGRLPAFLLDAYHPDQRGGTGMTGDWGLASSLAGQYPLLLAGGLTPANVANAVRSVQPWGVDVASGVEETPGRKNHDALHAFVAAAKTAPGDRRDPEGLTHPQDLFPAA
jgi:phosphoribosylanthranilate isomerase